MSDNGPRLFAVDCDSVQVRTSDDDDSNQVKNWQLMLIPGKLGYETCILYLEGLYPDIWGE